MFSIFLSSLSRVIRRRAMLVCSLCAVLLCVHTAHASADIDWYKQIGAAGNDIAYSGTSDGSVYVVGEMHSALPNKNYEGLADAFISKYDSNGNLLWSDEFGTASDDRAISVAVNPNYVAVVGVTYGSLFASNAGEEDIFIRIYTTSGSLVSSTQIGTAYADVVRSLTIEDNYIYITGTTAGSFLGDTPDGNYRTFIRKYNISGSLEWTREFNVSSFDQGLGVLTTIDNVYVVGSTDGALPGFTNQGSSDMFIIKYDSNGNEVWSQQFGTSGFDLLFNIVADGSYLYVVGDVEGALQNQTASGSDDAFIRKLNVSDGSEVWTRQFGTSGFDEAFGAAVDTTGVYVAGYADGSLSGEPNAGGLDAYVRKYDGSGTLLYTKEMGTTGDEDVLAFTVKDGLIYVGGSTDGAWPGYQNGGGEDMYLLRLSQDTDNDFIFEPVDESPVTYSDDFSNGVSYGSIASRGDQTLSVKNATDTTNGIAVHADAGGGATPASIASCGIATTTVSAGDSFTILCGSVTFNVRSGSITSVLTADDGRVAEATIDAGDTLTFKATDGTIAAPSTNETPVIVTAGNKTVSLSPGSHESMPSDLPITVSTPVVQPAAIPIGSSTTLYATATAPSDEINDITGASYWIDADGPYSMEPQDGTFDESEEGASAVIPSFSAAGVHQLCIEGSDSVGNKSMRVCTLLAVYDPSAGYVTGGGQIDSPLGAYAADPTLTSKAHFGFVAAYAKGTNKPTGNTEFRFDAGELQFKSDSYDWLVVAGARAEYKGTGSIGKQSGYSFLLTAVDGNLLGGKAANDLFRMKIMDQRGSVIYDNQTGANDASTPTTAVTSGSIVIHSE